MLEGGGDQLGAAAVDVYADLSRLDADLTLARTKVEAFAKDMETKMAGATRMAMDGGTLALPQRELDAFTAQINKALGDVTAKAAESMGQLSTKTGEAITEVSGKAGEAVTKLDSAVSDASKQSAASLEGLNKTAQELQGTIAGLKEAGTAAVQAPLGAGGPRSTGSGPSAPQADSGAKQAAADMARLDAATISLAKSYSPLHAAQLTLAGDLDKIRMLQDANVFSSKDAEFFTRKANEAYLEMANGTQKAGTELRGMGKWAEAAGEQIGRYSNYVMLAASVAGIAMVKSSLDQAKAIKSTADELNISTDAWQKYMFIAQQAGVSTGTLKSGFEQLQQATSKAATGAVKESKLFALLGVELEDANGKAKDQIALMPELADKLARVGDANEKAAAAQILFGGAAGEMMQVLEGGSARINELSDAAERMGIVLSDDQIQNADQTAQKLEDVKTVLSAQIAGIVANNATAIIGLANAFGQLTGAIARFWQSNPEQAMGLLGALGGAYVGGKIGGVYGAAIGGAAGFVGGRMVGSNMADENNDIKFREERLNEKRTRLANQRKSGRPSAATERQYQEELGRYDRAMQARFQQWGLGLPKPGAAPKPTDPNISLGGLNAPKPPKPRKGGGGAGPKGPDPERARIKGLRDDKAFEDQLSNFQRELLRAAGEQVTNANDKAKIDLALLDIEKQRYESMLALEGPGGTKKYNAAETDLLRTKFNEVDAAKRGLIERERAGQVAKDTLSISTSRLESEADILDETKKLARTNAERRELDLGLLNLQHKLENSQLDAVIASTESSDTEKEIARERKRHLGQLKNLQEQVLARETQGPIADFYDSIPRTAKEIEEAVERIRAAKLEDMQQRTVAFADSIGEAFGNLARSMVNLENPLDMLKSLVSDLAKTFTEEVIVRPMQNWAREKIGGPLAERVVGGTAGPEGLSMKQLETAGLNASTKLDKAAFSADRASTALERLAMAAPAAGAGGGGMFDFGGIGGFDVEGVNWDSSKLTMPSDDAGLGQLMADFGTDLDWASSSANAAGDALLSAAGAAGDFGNTLPGILNQLMSGMSGGGGGGGGLLKAALSIGGSLLTGGLGGGVGSAGLMKDAAKNMLANPGIFHEGGMIGPKGRPEKRAPESALGPLKPGEVDIRAMENEYVIPEGPAQKFEPMLEQMRVGIEPKLKVDLPRARLPTMPGLGGGNFGTKIDRRSFNVQTGDIVLPNAKDERSGRASGRQAAGALQSKIAQTVKKGMLVHD